MPTTNISSSAASFAPGTDTPHYMVEGEERAEIFNLHEPVDDAMAAAMGH